MSTTRSFNIKTSNVVPLSAKVMNSDGVHFSFQKVSLFYTIVVTRPDYLKTPEAMARFFNRGPRSDYMKRISIRHLTNPEAPLYGAAALYQDHACKLVP